MKNILIIFFLVIGSQLIAQELNKVEVDPKLNKEILIGKCDRQGLETSDVFKAYFNEGYSAYTPDGNIIKQLKKKKRGVKIVIVMGTWCGDSQEQVPHFYKILDEVGFKASDVKLICVDRAMTAGAVDITKYDIERVPTFLFYKDDREIGKIVESPMGTLEKDMLMILTIH
jgi:thiol-disulfide isomerase/thioredoxin